MNVEQIRKLLEDVASGAVSSADAGERLATLPYAELDDGDLGFAKLDLHRELRSGLPEAVFAEGKSLDDLAEIVRKLLDSTGVALATRVSPEKAAGLAEIRGAKTPPLVYNQRAGTARWGQLAERKARVAVLAAGTSDLPVAEEAVETLVFTGAKVDRYFDVGVAGLHRLLAHLDEIRAADVVIAVAGMDGALPTVVAGLVTTPVVAVPTSVGYGASFEGVAPLLTMLTGCAPGVAVVNIDNGYGAAVLAFRILRARTSD